jgi:rSAM/selenodomain-associated transferase 2
VARGEVLLFLHVDTRLPNTADALILDGLSRTGRLWGRFDVTIAGRHPLLPIVAGLMNRRSRLTGIATGDQGIFVRRASFESIGGYAEIPLMEDIALCRQLRRLSRPLCLRPPVSTSGRRWEQQGLLRTVLLMWRLRLAYFAGADPARLARLYGHVPRQS